MLTSGSPLEFSIRIRKLNGREINLTDLCLLFYNYKKQRVAIYDLRKHFKAFVHSGEAIEYVGRIAHFNLIEGIYYVGLYWGVDSVQGDLYDLLKLQLKDDASETRIKPYDHQYRGFVELF